MDCSFAISALQNADLCFSGGEYGIDPEGINRTNKYKLRKGIPGILMM
jgi:hypothetical protein